MDIYERLGIVPLINAAGTLTTLGGSLMPPVVSDAMAAASRAFVDMNELHIAAGRRIAELLGVEAVHVCAGASAGIALMAAACMAGDDPLRIARLPNTDGMKHLFLVQKSHHSPFDQALRVAGGQFVEIEADAQDMQAALSGEIAAVFVTLAWFCTSPALPLPQVAELAHRAGVPVIVDAAAELPPVENLSRFLKEGADLVVFSGGKALHGPQTSGVIVGRRDLVDACRLNDCPHMAVGRSMKAGKEEIVGLVRAVELYLAKDHAAEMREWEQRVAYILEVLSGLPGVYARRQLPYGAGQQIPHVALTWDEEQLRLTYQQLVHRLVQGEPRVAVQLVGPEDGESAPATPVEVRVHPHTLHDGEEQVVAGRIREELSRRC